MKEPLEVASKYQGQNVVIYTKHGLLGHTEWIESDSHCDLEVWA